MKPRCQNKFCPKYFDWIAARHEILAAIRAVQEQPRPQRKEIPAHPDLLGLCSRCEALEQVSPEKIRKIKPWTMYGRPRLLRSRSMRWRYRRSALGDEETAERK